MKDLTFESALSLATAIRSKQISCVEVMDAHLEQIARINTPLNALVHVCADTARQQASAADDALAGGNASGPFHGVPMTVKDAWELAGAPSTGGTIGRSHYIPDHDATVIARMRSAGAIPIGMTNVPELSLAFESDNLIYGRTSNPWNLSRTAGGSGGGGAAAIASGMSPVEIGADLGGSIRLPSHFCGTAGLRLTTGRAPMTGYFPPLMLGWVGDFTACGPMARSVDDLDAAYRVIAGPDWVDPHVFDMPLRPAIHSVQGLRIAIHVNNGIVPARSDVAATVERAGRALAEAGAVVDEAMPPGVDECLDIYLGISNSDAGEGLRALLAAAGTDRSHPNLNAVIAMGEAKPASFLHSLQVRRDIYRSRMLSFMKNYDLILCPVHAMPAIKHGSWLNEDVLPGFSYTIAYNITGWPGAVVRCGTSVEGLPIGVQAVAQPWREDVALVVARHIEAALGGYQQPTLAASA